MTARVAMALLAEAICSGVIPNPFFQTSRMASSAGIGDNCSAQNSGHVYGFTPWARNRFGTGRVESGNGLFSQSPLSHNSVARLANGLNWLRPY